MEPGCLFVHPSQMATVVRSDATIAQRTTTEERRGGMRTGIPPNRFDMEVMGEGSFSRLRRTSGILDRNRCRPHMTSSGCAFAT